MAIDWPDCCDMSLSLVGTRSFGLGTMLSNMSKLVTVVAFDCATCRGDVGRCGVGEGFQFGPSISGARLLSSCGLLHRFFFFWVLFPGLSFELFNFEHQGNEFVAVFILHGVSSHQSLEP